MLATFETAFVETLFNNLPCGDQDSLGVFQQRPSQGWGTPAQLQDVVYATNAFLGIFRFTLYSMPITILTVDVAIVNDAMSPGLTAG
jgi:hypothetical protein